MKEADIEKIIKPLKQNTHDLSIKEITKKTPYSRKTIEKYLPILEAQNKIRQTRQVGNSKFYTNKK